jgi:uncharacterized protein (TIGR03435 family)
MNIAQGKKKIPSPSQRLSSAMAAILAALIAVAVPGVSPLHAQQPPAAQGADALSPSFEVASIKKHVPDNLPGMRVMMGGPDISHFKASNVTVKMLIATAYSVREFQISGGPGWINSDRFDIDAKVDDALVAQLQKLTRQEQQAQQALMIRPLLADRFKLQFTRSTKDGSVLALVTTKGGPKIKQVPAPDPQATPPGSPLPPPARGSGPPTPPPGSTMMTMGQSGLMTLNMRAAPIGNLVNMLSMQTGQQVVDKTGLSGYYDVTLQFTADAGAFRGGPPPPGAGDSDAGGTSIFTALQEQLGLKLDSAKAPVDTITIDHIEEPSEN